MSNKFGELTFSRSEELIKTYRYYSSTVKDKEQGEVEKSLIVTTRRLILESTDNSGFSRDEFPVDFIERIDTKFYRSKKSLFGLIALVFGIVISVFSVIFNELINGLFNGFGFILIGFGVGLFVIGLLYLILKKSKQAFKLTLYSSKPLYDYGSISGENFISKDRFKKKEPKKIKVISKITPAAMVMLNELHSLILDIRDFNYQVEYGKKMVLSKKLSSEEYDHHYYFLLNKIVTLYK